MILDLRGPYQKEQLEIMRRFRPKHAIMRTHQFISKHVERDRVLVDEVYRSFEDVVVYSMENGNRLVVGVDPLPEFCGVGYERIGPYFVKEASV
jgi:hypothetical protein